MSAICGILRGSFQDYLADALPAPQRRILRTHLSVCAECRRLAAGADPTFLFARPLHDPVSPEETAAVLAAVKTGVALRETEKRIRRSRRRLAGGSVAAAAVVAMVLLLPGVGTKGGDPTRAVAPAPPAELPSDPALAAAAVPVESAAPASDATVYDWNPGAGREEPRVVWIVDRGLDI